MDFPMNIFSAVKSEIRNFLGSLGLFTKVTLGITLTVTLIICLVTALITVISSKSILAKEEALSREGLEKIHTSVLAKYNLMYNQNTLIYMQDHIASILSRTVKNPEDIYHQENVSVILSYLNYLCHSDADIIDTIIITEKIGRVFSVSTPNGRSVRVSYPFAELPEIVTFGGNGGNISIFYFEKPDFILGYNIPIISIWMKIYDLAFLPEQRTIGYLAVNYPLEVFHSSLRIIEELTKGDYYVTNEQTTVIYSSNSAALNKPFDSVILPKDAVVNSRIVGMSGIAVSSVLSRSRLRGDINILILQMFIILGFSVAVIFFTTALLYRYYRRHLAMLSDAMNTISSGNFSLRLPVERMDELGKISDTFNRTCETLDSYIKLNYIAEMGRRTAELNALQAQINPHFLFNTLEGIRMSALEAGAFETSEMLEKLGSLFRWIMRFDTKYVYLEDEIEYLESYLSLQRLRLGDCVDWKINIPSRLRFSEIPKFILQPAIENAVVHGLADREDHIRIVLSAKTEKGFLIITVADNGRGMSGESLGRFRSHIAGEITWPGFGIGMLNVHSRIRMLFGDPCGIIVESEERKGTVITITLPEIDKRGPEIHVQNDHNR
jgi:two-component system sensor histidine kinase YesM